MLRLLLALGNNIKFNVPWIKSSHDCTKCCDKIFLVSK